MKWLLVLIFLGTSELTLAKEVILDVRTPEEFAQGHIPNALNIDVLNPNFSTQVATLNRDDDYKVYCKMGSRARKAVTIMTDLRFKYVTNLESYEEAQKYFGTSGKRTSP